MSRHVPRRPGDPPRAEFAPLPFHGWYECRACSAVIVDWVRHRDWHDEDGQEDELPEGVTDLTARARTEGAAVVEFGAWRQALACLRLRPPKTPAPPPGSIPPGAAGRALRDPQEA